MGVTDLSDHFNKQLKSATWLPVTESKHNVPVRSSATDDGPLYKARFWDAAALVTYLDHAVASGLLKGTHASIVNTEDGTGSITISESELRKLGVHVNAKESVAQR